MHVYGKYLPKNQIHVQSILINQTGYVKYSQFGFQRLVIVKQDITSLKAVLGKYSTPLSVYPLQEEEINRDLLHLFINPAFLSTGTWMAHESTEEGILEASRINRTMVTKRVDGKIHGISFMIHLASNFGTTTNIYYYGKDIESFKALVVDQLKEVVKKRNSGMLGVFVSFTEGLEENDVCQFLIEQLEFNHGPAPDGTIVIISQKLDPENKEI